MLICVYFKNFSVCSVPAFCPTNIYHIYSYIILYVEITSTQVTPQFSAMIFWFWEIELQLIGPTIKVKLGHIS